MNKIKLTEKELNQIIKESVNLIIKENQELEEGWLGDKWNQTKTAAKTLTQKNDMNLKDRFNNAKKNWNTQGELNNINNLRQSLINFVEAGQIDTNMTIGQLIGGKYNNNKFGKMNAMANNRIGQIKRRGGE
jgi:hypothetical protein